MLRNVGSQLPANNSVVCRPNRLRLHKRDMAIALGRRADTPGRSIGRGGGYGDDMRIET